MYKFIFLCFIFLLPFSVYADTIGLSNKAYFEFKRTFPKSVIPLNDYVLIKSCGEKNIWTFERKELIDLINNLSNSSGDLFLLTEAYKKDIITYEEVKSLMSRQHCNIPYILPKKYIKTGLYKAKTLNGIKIKDINIHNVGILSSFPLTLEFIHNNNNCKIMSFLQHDLSIDNFVSVLEYVSCEGYSGITSGSVLDSKKNLGLGNKNANGWFIRPNTEVFLNITVPTLLYKNKELYIFESNN